MKELATVESKAQMSTTSPMQLVEMAIQSNADLDKLERLMALQDQWQANEAKKSFALAMAEFQRTCPDITKTKKAHNSMYAPLGDIVNQIRESLANCGLYYRFEQDHSNGVTVTCIISHVNGHSEKTTMSAPSDSSGSKNVIQAIASTVTYLSRYTLTAALGIVTADADMDGRLPVKDVDLIDPDQYDQLYALMCNEEGFFNDKGLRIAKAFKIDSLANVKADDFKKILGMASK